MDECEAQEGNAQAGWEMSIPAWVRRMVGLELRDQIKEAEKLHESGVFKVLETTERIQEKTRTWRSDPSIATLSDVAEIVKK